MLAAKTGRMLSGLVDTLMEHWPCVVIVFVLLGVLFFTLRRKAGRFSNQIQRRLEEHAARVETEVVALPIPPRNLSDTTSIAERKQQIWENIHKHPMPPYQQVELLVHQFAVADVDVSFQSMYFMICGSHHSFLTELNTRPLGRVPRSGAQAFLAKLAESDARIKRYDFAVWIGFLTERGLLSVETDSFSLTFKGQDLLVWITRKQLPMRIYEEP